MSVEKAKKFLVKVSTDERLAEKARAAHENALLSVAQQAGFDIGADDLREALSDIEMLDDLAVTGADEVVGGARFTGKDSVW